MVTRLDENHVTIAIDNSRFDNQVLRTNGTAVSGILLLLRLRLWPSTQKSTVVATDNYPVVWNVEKLDPDSSKYKSATTSFYPISSTDYLLGSRLYSRNMTCFYHSIATTRGRYDTSCTLWFVKPRLIMRRLWCQLWILIWFSCGGCNVRPRLLDPELFWNV